MLAASIGITEEDIFESAIEEDADAISLDSQTSDSVESLALSERPSGVDTDDGGR